MRTMTTNTRCAIYTAAVLAACLIARATFAAEPVPVVNVNTATAEQLTYLPDIGPKTAATIVLYRTEHGPFATVDALDNVKGIGPAKLAAMRPHVVLTGATTAKAKIKVPKTQKS